MTAPDVRHIRVAIDRPLHEVYRRHALARSAELVGAASR